MKMVKMGLPGFNAEASLYMSKIQNYIRLGMNTAGQVITPQLIKIDLPNPPFDICYNESHCVQIDANTHLNICREICYTATVCGITGCRGTITSISNWMVCGPC
jgi:hypothetical protein